METQLWAVGLVILAGVFGGLGPILFKKASERISLRRPSSIFLNRPLILGVAVSMASLALFTIALTSGELSVLYPLVGLAYVWVCIYAKCLLKEKMSLAKWLGISLILIGVALIGVSV